MTRRLIGFAAAAVVGVALGAGAGTQTLAGNSWDGPQDASTSQGTSNTSSGTGNSWD